MSVVVLNKGKDLIFPSLEFYSGWENHSKESCAKPAKMMRWDDDGAAPVQGVQRALQSTIVRKKQETKQYWLIYTV